MNPESLTQKELMAHIRQLADAPTKSRWHWAIFRAARPGCYHTLLISTYTPELPGVEAAWRLSLDTYNDHQPSRSQRYRWAGLQPSRALFADTPTYVMADYAHLEFSFSGSECSGALARWIIDLARARDLNHPEPAPPLLMTRSWENGENYAWTVKGDSASTQWQAMRNRRRCGVLPAQLPQPA